MLINKTLFVCLSIALLNASTLVFAADDREDFDVNKNGLIEIYDLADLDEMRNDLTGKTLYGDDAGCPEGGCRGVELMADLDFDTNADGIFDADDTYWNDGKGWEPIGDADEAYIGFIEGNGHVVKNLFIDRPDEQQVGLFGVIHRTTVRRIGVSGSLSYVRGEGYTGILVGLLNFSQAEAVFTTGRVVGVPLLLGGIAGYMFDSSMANSFSTAKVSDYREDSSWPPAGGLTGTLSNGEIRNSYLLIPLVDGPAGGSVFYSYEVPSQSVALHPSRAVTIAELKCPRQVEDPQCRDGLFRDWGVSLDMGGTPLWSFGNRFQLPGLVLNGRLFRDSDGDGLLDEDDNDIDGDEVINLIDAFPENPAAAVDDDIDGLPDQWNPSCDSSCQLISGLVLDGETNAGGADPTSSAGSVNWVFIFLLGAFRILIRTGRRRVVRF